jgi:ribosomal protein S18 acetylase RimI-like enzyme
LQNSPKSRLGRRLIPPLVLEDLASGTAQFPYTCELFPNYDVPLRSLFWKPTPQQNAHIKADESSDTCHNHQQEDNKNNHKNSIIMTIRVLQTNDIQTVTDMCCQEYGVGDVAANLRKTMSTAIQRTDFKTLNRLAQDLLDEFILRRHVEITMRLKAVHQVRVPQSPSQQQKRKTPPPPDHAVLLLTLADQHAFKSSSSPEETIVGMVEVSRQPPIPERNPPAFPLPLAFKQMYCWWWNVSQHQKRQQAKIMKSFLSRFSSNASSGSNNEGIFLTRQRMNTNNMVMMKQPEGWITNVLVAPEFRSMGWSKVLVHACEGVARSWNVPAIHLHCDADGVSGRVAQKLYTSMGYTDNNQDSSCNIVNGSDANELSSTSSEFDWLKLAAKAEAAATGFTTTTEPVMCSSSVYVIEGVPLLYLKKDLV